MSEDTPTLSDAYRLGANLSDVGCGFVIWAPRALRVELALVEADGSTIANYDMAYDNGVWHVHVADVVAGQRYGFRIHGEWDPDAGLRANPAKLLVDPYARAITAGVDYAGPIFDHTPASDYEPDTDDSAPYVPLSVVVAPAPPPSPIARRLPMSDLVIYETHVKGATHGHPRVPEHLRETFLGFSHPAMIEYLTDLGINAVEFLPIHHFVSEPFVIGRGLSNYWGYNTLSFFAPHAGYASSGTLGEQVEEFKAMVSALHEAGIEVILDVVFNHTCEGNHEGPTLSFRGIDHEGYYRLVSGLRDDYDVTGTGNSLDTAHADVLRLVIDSLHYWVEEMGVDGFRFDLATTLIRDANHMVDHNHLLKQAIANDPVFADIKFIAEPWDIGPSGYQVGAWGSPWSEWNDKFRACIRDYWRGALPGVTELATRLAGSPDLFDIAGRTPAASVNFITAHDGFTARDLATYNVKHNEANGEDNRDGSDDNRSWNCGVEGETDDAEIISLRHRQVRNLMLTLLLADGTPMITAGDEMGRTQQGNNNAYCQDSPISWTNWEDGEIWDDVRDLVRKTLTLRANEPLLRPHSFRYHDEIIDPNGRPTGRFRLAWLNEYSGEMGESDWHDRGRRLLGMYLGDEKTALVVWYYAGADPISLRMPPSSWGKSYTVLLSSAESGELPETPIAAGESIIMPGRTTVLMRVEL